MRSGGIRCGAWWAVFCLAMGCGGRADSGSGAPAGPLAACGDSCSQSEVSASCSSICAKLAQAGCSAGSGDCATSCSSAVSMTPACSSLALAFLRCLETAQPTCPTSRQAQFVACDSAQQSLEDCLNRAGPTVVTSPSGPSAGGPLGAGSPVPADVCPDIPRPVGGGSCSGGGSASASGSSSGSGATATCESSCQDSAGNTWQASCAGSTCTCTFNGGQACTCMMTGAPGTCSSCCPGT
jgi:hypothetical protein